MRASLRRHTGTLIAAASLTVALGDALAAQSRRTARTGTSAAPRPTAPARTWAAVSAGGAHTCALDQQGLSWCWGDNAWKRLGIADSVNQRRPVRVETPQRFRSIQAGALETCAITADGSVVCWGGEQPGNAPHQAFGDLRFRSIDMTSNGCGVTTDGVGYCWGANNSGQLGSGRASPARSTGPERVAGRQRWLSIIAGSNYGCGIATDNAAYCWGNAALLGNTAGQNSNVPVRVPGNQAWQQLAGGSEHVCGLTSEGAAWCWGSNSYGTLGNGLAQNSARPVAVAGTNTFKELAAGYAFTCGLTNQGRVFCWGWNQNGILGTGTTVNASRPTRVGGEPFTFFTSISAGTNHICGVGADGAIYCWGDNADGALGIARSQTCRTPVGAGRAEARACAMVPTKVQDPR